MAFGLWGFPCWGFAVFRRGVARFLAVILCVVAPGLMVLPASVAADPVVEGVITFADVPDSSMFYKEISWLAAEGISTGWDVGGGVREYRPLQSIARDAMAAFLYRKAGSPAYTPPTSSPFIDVAPGAAFYKEITWLASKGISTGWDVGGGKREYRPLNSVARDAMAAFLFRFAQPSGFTAPSQSPFADVPAGAAFYKEITWLASAGISTGWDVGGGVREYRPLNSIARDAMAAFLYRLDQKMAPHPAPDCTPPLTHLSGTMTADRTLSTACSTTYQIDSDFTVAAGATLAIGAGTTVQAAKDVRVIVEGSLRINGTETEPILLTAAPSSTPTVAGGAELVTEGLQAQVVVEPASGSWKGIEVKPGGSVTSTNLTVRYASTAVSAQALATSSTPTTVSLGATAIADADVCLSLQGPVVGHFQGSVRKCVVGVAADHTFNATNIDWGGGQGPGEAGSGRPTLQGSNVSVYPWTGVSLPPPPEAVSTSPSSEECTDYLFIGVRGSGESATAENLGMGDTIKDTYDTFNAEVKARKPGTGVRYVGLEYPAYGVPIISQWDKILEYVPGAWQGAVELLTVIEREQERCASAGERIALAGYSQGAWAIHTGLNYAATSDRVDLSKVAAVGLLGDAQRISGATETQLGDAPGFTYGVTNTMFLSAPIYGFSDWLASAVDPSVWEWKLTADVPMDKIVSIQGIPDAVRSSTASFCGRYDPVCGLGDAAITPAVHSYPEGRTKLGQWMAGQIYKQLTNVSSISAGWSAALALTRQGTVYSWGANESGQLGDGSTTERLLPVQVKGLDNVVQVSGGGNHSLALTGDGSVYAWGYNEHGQLGDGTETNRLTPTRVQGLSNVVQVFAGVPNSLAVTRDGQVFGWGANSYGQLSEGLAEKQSIPKPILGLSNIASVSADSFHALAVTKAGEVYFWGRGYPGNGEDETITPVPQKVSGLSGIVKVTTGQNHSLALTSDGRVYGWGDNYYGQVGNGAAGFLNVQRVPSLVSSLPSVVDIDAGFGHSIALAEDGTVFTWGSNWRGEMGSGNTYPSQPTPVAVGSLAGITDVSASYSYSMAVGGDGTLYAWGFNALGDLGNGTKIDVHVPSPVLSGP